MDRRADREVDWLISSPKNRSATLTAALRLTKMRCRAWVVSGDRRGRSFGKTENCYAGSRTARRSDLNDALLGYNIGQFALQSPEQVIIEGLSAPSHGS